VHLNLVHTVRYRNDYDATVATADQNSIIEQSEGKIGFCGCGQFYEDTAAARAAHCTVCEIMRELRSWQSIVTDGKRSLPCGFTIRRVPTQSVTDSSLSLIWEGCTLHFQMVECGSTFGSDWNICFYLSCVGVPLVRRGGGMFAPVSDVAGRQAIQLKASLAPVAEAVLRHERKRSTRLNCHEHGVMAERDVLLAYAETHGRVAVISNAFPAEARLFIYEETRADEIVWLFHRGDHFQRLARIDDGVVNDGMAGDSRAGDRTVDDDMAGDSRAGDRTVSVIDDAAAGDSCGEEDESDISLHSSDKEFIDDASSDSDASFDHAAFDRLRAQQQQKNCS
jgi:hypothetical protein